MGDSFLTLTPEIAVDRVFYSPGSPEDPTARPRIRVSLDHLMAAVLSMSIADARALRAGLDAALAEHDALVAELTAVLAASTVEVAA